MDRRGFLAIKRKTEKQEILKRERNYQITSGLNTYTGTWARNEVIHLLKRTMFGAKPEDISYFQGLSMTQAVDQLLNVSATAPAPPLKNYDNTNIAAGDPDYAITIGQTWVNTNTYDGTANYFRRNSLKAWCIGLMLNQDRSILEKMVMFWQNHFVIEADIVDFGTLSYQYNKLLRQSAVGNFKQLAKDVTLSPGMLSYLNGTYNGKDAPDENYARELQELFTVGKENNPNYTEADVQTAARVLTGWKVDFNTNNVYFDPSDHDTGNKVFSSFYNHTVQGKTGATGGMEELDDMLNMIFSKQQQVAKFIVKKIYRHFVYYKIDADTETNVIGPLAQLFINNNWEIKPVLETLLKSEHFFDFLNQGCFIKTPVDFSVGLCREYGVAFPAASAVEDVYTMWGFLRDSCAVLQQDVCDPPDVAGWKAFYQVPQFYESWINSDTLPFRNIVTDILISEYGFTPGNITLNINAIDFTKKLPNASDPNALIDDVLQILYRIDVKAETKALIKKQILLSGQDKDYYWTNAWNSYLADPSQMNFNIINSRLRNLYKYFMNLAEYHLC